MKRMGPWLGTLVVVLSAGSFARAQVVKDPADLLPAQTLACVEFRHPNQLARETGLLIKGSALEDIAGTMAKFRAKTPREQNWWIYQEIGMMGLFVSPEMLSEFGRFQGGNLALTGVSKDKGPQWAGVLLSGESNFPGLYMRAWLTMSDEMKSVGETEGVMVYRERRRIYDAPPPAPKGAPQPPPQPREEAGMTMAMMPGMLIFGSTPDQVNDVIRRAKGKSNDPALSSMRAFRDSSKLRERPGIFAYSDMEALAGQMEEAIKTLGPEEKAYWNMFKTAVNPRAFRAATASLTVQNSNVELHAQVKLVPGQTSPLLDLLPDKKADVQLFQYVPRDALATLSAGLGDGEKRWSKMVALIDAMAKNQGESDLNLPSKAIKEMQQDLRIDFGKDVFAKIKGAAVCVVPNKQDPAPMYMIQATDATAAKYLTDTAIPKLAQLAAKKDLPAPKKEEVDGLAIYSVPMPFLVPMGQPLHYYGSHGDMVVMGPDAKRVAAALKGGSKKDGFLSETRYANALKEADGSVATGVVSVGAAIVAYFKELESNGGPRFNAAVPVAPPGGPGVKPAPVPEPKLSDRAEKAIQDMTKVVEPLPPLVYSLSRKDDLLVLEARQLGLKTISVKLIDLWLEAALERQAERMGRNFGGVGAKVAPAPPPPPAEKVEKKQEEKKDNKDKDKNKDR